MNDILRINAIRQTKTTLKGISRSLVDAPSARVPSALLLIPLKSIGDALRLGIDIDRPVRRWSETIPESDLRGAIAALLEETATWNLPVAHAVDDHELALVIRRRDEAESVRSAVWRISMPRLNPYDLEEFAGLVGALVAIDEALARLVSRADVARMLGARAALEPAWADAFEERETPPQSDERKGERWPAWLARVAPSDEVITRYVMCGAMSCYVEGVAAANETFAEDLAGCIDALLEAGEDIGPVARKWRGGR